MTAALPCVPPTPWPPGDPRDAEFSALEVSPDGRTAFLADPLGNLDVVDLRAPPVTRAVTRGGGEGGGGGAAEAAAEGAAALVGGLNIHDR